jgi:serpin B
MKVPMMNATYERNIKYVVNDEYSSIALPYKSEGEYNYELVAILPKDLDGFIDSLNDEKINNVMKDAKEANDKTNVYLSLPQFNYDFKLEDSDFIKVLNKLGINLAFDAVKADFSRFITRENMEKVNIPNMSVTKAVHKTFIDLNEVGTKAAAVTYFGVDKNEAVLEQPEVVRINFNKPFVYMIRETGTNEILFFGIVYEPKEWTGSTCASIDREL